MLIDKKINELIKERDFLRLMIARLESLTATPSTEKSIIDFEHDVQKYNKEINVLRLQLERGIRYV